MKISSLISGSLALALAATSITPVMAAPAYAPNDSVRSSVVQVQTRQRTEEEEQLRRQRRGENQQRNDASPRVRGEDGQRRQRTEDGQRRPRGDENRPRQRVEQDRQAPRYRAETVRPDRSNEFAGRRVERDDRRDQRRQHRFERRGNQAYYNGHRGYRERRNGYRYYEGFWFPAGAFLLGAIIAGQNNGYRNNDWEDHVDWCYERYGNRYRERDNSYIGRDGYRRECISPYN